MFNLLSNFPGGGVVWQLLIFLLLASLLGWTGGCSQMNQETVNTLLTVMDRVAPEADVAVDDLALRFGFVVDSYVYAQLEGMNARAQGEWNAEPIGPTITMKDSRGRSWRVTPYRDVALREESNEIPIFD